MHPFLAEYHNESLEPSSTTKFNFDFENGGAHMSKTDIQKLTHGEMRCGSACNHHTVLS